MVLVFKKKKKIIIGKTVGRLYTYCMTVLGTTSMSLFLTYWSVVLGVSLHIAPFCI